MTRTVTTSVARVGNSNAIIVPKDFLRLLHLEPRDKVEITRSDEGLFIKPLPKWTQEGQANAAKEFIKELKKLPSDDIDLNDCRYKKRPIDLSLFNADEV